jgi:hypothetical protein
MWYRIIYDTIIASLRMTSGLEGSRLQLRYHILNWRWLDIVWSSNSLVLISRINHTGWSRSCGRCCRKWFCMFLWPKCFCAHVSYGEWLWCYGRCLILMNTHLWTAQLSPCFVSTAECWRCEHFIGKSLLLAYTIFRIERRDDLRLRVGFSKT